MGRINPRRFVKACKNSGGIITLIAKRLSCERLTVYSFLNKNPEMSKYLQEAKEEIIDMAESHLFNAVNKGEMEEVKWFLSRMGANRGYMVKPEVNIIDKQQNIQINNIRELIDKNEAIWTSSAS